MSRFLPALLLVAVALLPTAAFAGPRANVVRWVNDYRLQHARYPLKEVRYLDRKAEQWAKHLAAAGKLSHGDMPCFCGGTIVGQNVGYGPSAWAVEQAFQQSPKHRDNILEVRYRQIGVGVVRRGHRVYVVEDFRG